MRWAHPDRCRPTAGPLAAELAAAGLVQAERHRILDGLEWWRDKPPALVLLDDRALTFTGAWPKLDALLAFRPWNRRGPG